MPELTASLLIDLDARNHRGYEPDPGRLLALAEAARGAFAPAADETRTALLVVDPQNDFCYPEGALFVAGRDGDGARRDLARLVAWAYRNLDRLTTIAATMDEHFLHQIFHPVFWLRSDGRHPDPHTTVTADDVRSGRLRLNPAVHALVPVERNDRRPEAEWAERQALDYLERLAAAGRYDLTIWPFHCLKGGAGQNVAGIVRELMQVHAFLRLAPPVFIAKGDNTWTESYSAVGPEIAEAFDRTPLRDISAARPRATVEHVMRSHRRIYIAGQALSHCVLWTLTDMVRLVEEGRVVPAPDIHVLMDASSAVVVRDLAGAVVVDFTAAALDGLRRLAERPYIHLTSTEEPIPSGGDIFSFAS